jgi:hypothetical protein
MQAPKVAPPKRVPIAELRKQSVADLALLKRKRKVRRMQYLLNVLRLLWYMGYRYSPPFTFLLHRLKSLGSERIRAVCATRPMDVQSFRPW